MNELGSLIKRKREELGLSQEELARILGYKHKSSINKIELGLADVPRTKVPAFSSKVVKRHGSRIYSVIHPFIQNKMRYVSVCRGLLRKR